MVVVVVAAAAYGAATVGANGIFNARLLAGGAIITNGETVMDITAAQAASIDCSGGIVADVNECATSNGGCDDTATCTNTVGSRTCACKGSSLFSFLLLSLLLAADLPCTS